MSAIEVNWRYIVQIVIGTQALDIAVGGIGGNSLKQGGDVEGKDGGGEVESRMGG